MSKDKELSADVKTVLHGEVLGPDEGAAYSHAEKRQKVKMIMDDPIFQEQNSRIAQHYQEQWYQQQQYNSFQNQYMRNMMGSPLGGLGPSFPLKTQYSHKKPWSLVDFLFGRD